MEITCNNNGRISPAKIKFVPDNEKEKATLDILRKATTDLQMEDHMLLRFLRAREGNPDRAEDMLRKSLKWRKENNVSSFLTWEPPKYLKDDFIYETPGYDNDGRPVMWFPIARWNARQWIEDGRKEDLLNWRLHIFETGDNLLKKSGSNQVIIIIGLEELTYWKIASLETMQLLYSALKDLEANYPEILKTLFFVNAPWIFQTAYSFFRPIFTTRTQNKFRVFDSDHTKWIPALLEYMPKDAIPKAYSHLVKKWEDQNSL